MRNIDIWLLWSSSTRCYSLSFSYTGCVLYVPIGARESTVSCLYFDQLWLSVMLTICWKKRNFSGEKWELHISLSTRKDKGFECNYELHWLRRFFWKTHNITNQQYLVGFWVLGMVPILLSEPSVQWDSCWLVSSCECQ